MGIIRKYAFELVLVLAVIYVYAPLSLKGVAEAARAAAADQLAVDQAADRVGVVAVADQAAAEGPAGVVINRVSLR